MRRHYLLAVPLAVAILFSNAALADRLAVSDSAANIRSGPGKNYSIKWKIGKYHPILVLDTSGEWLQFRDYQDHVGWIHQSLVSNVPAVITKTDNCNVRSGPGTFHRKLATVGKGVPFKVIKEEGDWLNIQHAGGFIGWIHKSLIW